MCLNFDALYFLDIKRFWFYYIFVHYFFLILLYFFVFSAILIVVNKSKISAPVAHQIAVVVAWVLNISRQQ